MQIGCGVGRAVLAPPDVVVAALDAADIVLADVVVLAHAHLGGRRSDAGLGPPQEVTVGRVDVVAVVLPQSRCGPGSAAGKRIRPPRALVGSQQRVVGGQLGGAVVDDRRGGRGAGQEGVVHFVQTRRRRGRRAVRHGLGGCPQRGDHQSHDQDVR